MEDGFHVVTLPANLDDKRLASVDFSTAYAAYNVARTLSTYNHKTTLVVYSELGKQDIRWVFVDGQENEWF